MWAQLEDAVLVVRAKKIATSSCFEREDKKYRRLQYQEPDSVHKSTSWEFIKQISVDLRNPYHAETHDTHLI